MADSVKNLFKPLAKDVQRFSSFLNRAFRKELSVKTMIPVYSETPEVYQAVGFNNKPVNMRQKVLSKNTGYHVVSQKVLERLPELMADPVIVMESRTEKGSLVAILDAVDENGNIVEAILKPENKDFNVIPSVYGKEKLFEQLMKSHILYEDTKNASNLTAVSTLQLREWNQTQGYNDNILQKSDVVKKNQQTFKQGENNPLGSYMPASRVIHLFKKANRSTLIHELGHHFTMQYVKVLEANGQA